ncbi:transcriptional regulator family: Fungal Specific TF [Penicillium odoratum]|uniref:transcriptional regulator family: Fungal Specific TF n=1 Tax=Penicillium odoratum TaxID=1167516 RepID=UPI002549B2AD|nr:transcriptional regulator family: Fungal Specific TF [Penicillium odoratum]KAJ5771989.1 transcriptional regulator family: Fungal Specific TF [Penicillium odoratum]
MPRQLTDLTIRAQTYECLLRTLRPQLDTTSAGLIEKALATAPQVPELTYGSVFSLGAFDYTDEDMNHDSKLQSMGYIGQPSEMAYLYRLKRQLDHDASGPASHDSISRTNYFLDDTDVPIDQAADLSVWPPKPEADLLVHHYFEAIHPVFPVIGKLAFTGQYRRFYSNPNVRPGHRWRAVLNMIFAIAARNVLLRDKRSSIGLDDHQVYFSRAWQLSLENATPLNHPDLQQVQIESLIALYMLSIGHVNRSWRIIGVAIRSGMTMGVNLRSTTESIAPLYKETRYRLWWALIMLEMLLCEMTGRPPCTGVNFCTTPLPVPYPEEQFGDERLMHLFKDHPSKIATTSASRRGSSTSLDKTITGLHPVQPEANSERPLQPQHVAEILTPNDSLFLLYTVELSLLKRDAINTLYAPAAAHKPWHEVKAALCTLNDDTERWLSRLPPELQIAELNPDTPFLRQRTSIALQFYSTKLIISQSCLCPLGSLPSEVEPVTKLCDNMADMCVKMAGLILGILPDIPDITYLNHLPPWWVVFHYLMQSSVVLLGQLFTRARAGTAEAVAIIQNLIKATGWLELMSTRDASSKRAWVICMDLLYQHGEKVGFEVDPDD